MPVGIPLEELLLQLALLASQVIHAATVPLGDTPLAARSNRSALAFTATGLLGNARLEGTRLGEQRLRIA